ncbi:ABC-type sugar transport system, periplasmic component [Brachybacterium faecium DSM 4810]|uniref:ABC-type sugar transport system, periplasmic component n=1 Tax=Brachybacterium faecium (strain ATCC 43885 / DSM 4810 / JCM 11609 / LMG 19847 / NBRC 14762 / NCIMB 9860 / 6-10) TaxID=446465 RepID=C7MAV7_BRAFD|nr:ABC transporter substrate-binding protein [Brachybacterium faecium]ACU86844.1 ABC-type sugar transport system, periplasmic component [Brachybacterium faecium DSM 4810]
MSRSPLTPSRRSLLAALGLGAGAAGLAACGAPGGGGDSESPVRDGFSQADLTVPSEYQDRTPILFWAPFTGENYEVLSTLFAEFNESQDEIVAIAESVGSYEDLNQKFTASLQARTVPDIVCFPEMQWLQFHQAGALAPLDGYFDEDWNLDIFIESYVAEGKAAGETYVVPFARSTPLFYYNKTRYIEAGLPEEGPETWEDLAEFAPELAAIQVEGRPLSAMAFSGDAWLGQADLWGFGGANATEDFQVTIQDERGAEWLEWMRSFIHDDGYGYLAQDSATDFASGLAAGWRGSTASLTGQTDATEGVFEIGTAYMLAREGEEKQVPTGGSGLSLVRSDSQDRQDACAELFRFLAQPEQSATWHLGTGYVPVVQAAQEVQAVKDQVAANPNYGVALAQLENARTADYTNWDQGSITEIGAAMGQVFGDAADPQEVLDTLAATLQETLDDNREDYEAVAFEGWN